MRSEFGASFVGRTRELRELTSLLRDRNLVTILGEGGVGKTRLAREVTRLLDADGWPTFWIELGAVTDGSRIRPAFEDVLRPSRSTDSLEGLIAERVPDGRALIIVDNCEHVLSDVADAIRVIGTVRPETRILATSRTRLGVPGEVIRRLGPLPVPSPSADQAQLEDVASVTLLIDRLADVDDEFEFGPDNMHDVMRLAAATEGVPLAIELVAASAGALPLPEIARTLDELGHLAVTDTRRQPRRHRSLDASVRWSVDRLGTDATRAFRRLGVFADTFRLTSGVRVISAEGERDDPEARRTLAELVDASLVRRLADDRYSLPMAVRTFAQDELASDPDAAAVRDRHAEVVRDLVAEARSGLRRRGADGELWLRLVDLELPEIRSAMSWQLSRRRPDEAAGLVIDSYDHANMRGRYDELTAQCRDVLAHPLLPKQLSAEVSAVASLSAVMAGRLADGFEFADRAVSTADDPAVRADALLERAWSGFFSGRIGGVALWNDVDEALRLADASGSKLRQANARQRYGSLLVIGRSIDEGRRVLRATAESRGGAPEHMVLSCRLFALYGVPVFGLRLDELWDETTSLIDDCRAAGHVAYGSMALSTAGAILALRGDPGADELLDRARELTVTHELPTFENVVQRWRAFAHYCFERPDMLEQAEYALHLAERTSNEWDATAARWLIGLDLLGKEDELAGSHLRAAAMSSARTGYPSMQSRVDLGLALLDLNHDDFAVGITRVHDAIVRSHEYGDLLAVASGLDHLGRFEAERSAYQRAARFAGAADSIYERAGMERLPCERGLRAAVAGRLAEHPADEIRTALAEGRALDPDAAVRLARRSRGRRSRPVSGWSSLTPTEHDVADLAATGLTNRAIADRLVMSTNTVKTHLSHVYAKIGVSGRGELAAERARRPETS